MGDIHDTLIRTRERVFAERWKSAAGQLLKQLQELQVLGEAPNTWPADQVLEFVNLALEACRLRQGQGELVLTSQDVIAASYAFETAVRLLILMNAGGMLDVIRDWLEGYKEILEGLNKVSGDRDPDAVADFLEFLEIFQSTVHP